MITHPRRVLVLTLSFGSGHVRAARAIARELSRQAPGAQIDVVDALAGCRLTFRAGYVWPYWAMVRYAPALWRRLFDRRLARSSGQTAPGWAFRFGCPQVFETIARVDPGVIIAAEVAACEMAVIARRRALTSAAIVNVITDRHAEPAWVKPEADAYAVADSTVREQLEKWGAPADSIVACGIPIDAGFETESDARATRERYGLTGDKPLVLLMGGGMGPTRMDQIAARLCASGQPMHVVAVTGHDVRVRRRLAGVREAGPVSLTVLEWIDDVPALMQAAAVLVTKPGGMTTAEAAVCRLPSVMFDAIPGPEEHNAARIVDAGAGILARGAGEAAAAVLGLLRDPDRRRAMSACAHALARPDAAGAIARLALVTHSRERVQPVLPPSPHRAQNARRGPRPEGGSHKFSSGGFCSGGSRVESPCLPPESGSETFSPGELSRGGLSSERSLSRSSCLPPESGSETFSPGELSRGGLSSERSLSRNPWLPPSGGRTGAMHGVQDESERRPVLILTIGNGAGHTRVAEAIAEAVRADPEASVRVIDVADYMTRAARLTHVTLYLWLVKYMPALWDRIDRYQKRQPRTSPEWYYRRGCHRLFDLVRTLRPRALVATEVGCCEIAALIKRDLALDIPLVAVNGEYDADRAWVQREVDLYCAPTGAVSNELCAHGAPPERLRVWGVPLAPGFTVRQRRVTERTEECRRLGFVTELPLIIVAGGSEGLGRVEAIAARLLGLQPFSPQIVVLAGRNERLKGRCERLARGTQAARLRVLGWTPRVPELMRSADLMVSKPGHTFDEAIASALPLVALEPPPGSERVQYRLLDEWGIGRAVRTLDEMADAVAHLLANRGEIEAMQRAASTHRTLDAAQRIASWIGEQTGAGAFRLKAEATMKAAEATMKAAEAAMKAGGGLS